MDCDIMKVPLQILGKFDIILMDRGSHPLSVSASVTHSIKQHPGRST